MSEWIICLTVVSGSLISAIGMVIWYRRKTRRIMESMDQMLDTAIRGEFLETHFDESMLSAVETKLAEYLTASELSARNQTLEKEKIKELIGDISHQTKTPLANILLYGQLLQEQELEPASVKCIEPLCDQAEKLQFLIAGLVKISRLETGILELRPEQASIMELMNAAYLQFLPQTQDKNIQIVCVETDATAIFDMKWTAEALCNLLDNAVKYTPSGGSITLEATSYEMFCRIMVTDNGIGIPEQEHARIFTRFYRSSEVVREQGLGIGLYLSRQIVISEGGYLKVESELGKGASFSIFLPRVSGNLS